MVLSMKLALTVGPHYKETKLYLVPLANLSRKGVKIPKFVKLISELLEKIALLAIFDT